MIVKSDLKQIAQARLEDAEILLTAGRFDGAVYLCGYAIELGLKYRICETLNWNDFPKTNNEFNNLTSLKTHDLNVLLRLSGVENAIKTNHFTQWSTVSRWKPEWRYDDVGTVNQLTARNMIDAAKILLGILV